MYHLGKNGNAQTIKNAYQTTQKKPTNKITRKTKTEQQNGIRSVGVTRK